MEYTDKQELIDVVLTYGLEELEYASKELLGDRKLILDLVREYEGDYHDVLEYASEELRDDKNFISELAYIKRQASIYDLEEQMEDKDRKHVVTKSPILSNEKRKREIKEREEREKERAEREKRAREAKEKWEKKLLKYQLLQIELQFSKKKEEQHTSQEIAQGIEPTESAIKEVQAEMISEQTRDTVEQTNNAEQKQ